MLGGREQKLITAHFRLEEDPENLGEFLTGDRIENSGYKLFMKEEVAWLLAARQFDGFNFDQYIHRGVIHSSAMRDGRRWWSQREDRSSAAAPTEGRSTMSEATG